MLKLIVISVLLLSSPLWAKNEFGIEDGSDWKQFSQSYKIGWIDGFVTAMSAAQVNTAALCTFQLNLRSDSKEFSACAEDAQDFNFEMIKYGQYLDGVDTFYKDFRNMDYPINLAIKLVRDQIRGRSAEDIEKELVGWRQCHADKSKCLQYLKPSPPAPKQQ
jgi:hypothetical protein